MTDFVKNFSLPNNLSSKGAHLNVPDTPSNKFRKTVKESDVSQASPIFITTPEPITTLGDNINDLLHDSKRSVILKDEYKSEFKDIIPKYVQLVQSWLEGCLSYRFVGERIGKQISKNDKMSKDPATSVVSGVEAVISLIENNIPLGCLDNTTLDKLSKDQVVVDLVGKICNNLAIPEEEREEVVIKCCEYYDNIEFEAR